MSRPAHPVVSHALPIDSGRSVVEQTLAQLDSVDIASEGGALLSRAASSLRVSDLDRHLFAVRDDVSCAKITQWRREFLASHAADGTAVTVEGAVNALRAASLPPMRKRRRTEDRSSANSTQSADNTSSTSLLDAIEQRAKKRRQMTEFEESLQSIEPLDVPSPSANVADDQLGRECQICFDRFLPEHTLHCLVSDSHIVCCKCFYQYAQSSASSHSLASLPCPQCQQTYDRLVLQVHLPPQLFEQMDRRQASVDWRVALASNVEATLYCECGLVGIIERDSIGDRTVACAQCQRCYCLKCGNYAHAGSVCPAPRETIRWLESHRGKCCPNCGEGIEKNGGCTHMTCRSCCHQFCWRCLGAWPRCR